MAAGFFRPDHDPPLRIFFCFTGWQVIFRLPGDFSGAGPAGRLIL